MKVTIDIESDMPPRAATKRDIQKNIDAVRRAVDGKPTCTDFVPLISVEGMLVAIQKQLVD